MFGVYAAMKFFMTRSRIGLILWKFVIGLRCRWAADMQKLKEEFESAV